MFSATRMTHPSAGHAPTKTKGLVGWLLALDAQFRERKRLQSLSASMKRDIGLTDAQIAQELAKPIWNAPQHWLR